MPPPPPPAAPAPAPDPDALAAAAHAAYAACAHRPPPAQYTILAAAVLARGAALKVVALATGAKCLPAARLPPCGDALHDSHAEVLARRGALRWLLDEAARHTSTWLVRAADGTPALAPGAALHLYVSTVPCGDASTRFLAAAQDAAVAALKDASPPPAPAEGAAARGRDGYARLGVLRTKPGRADAPPTASMSCSDKIAAWGVLGLQGALGARLLRPVYLAGIVIGEVPPEMRDGVREDCARALWARVSGVQGLPEHYAVHRPSIQFTSLPFVHSRSVVLETTGFASTVTSCNESLCWVADSNAFPEVLINGLRRGVPPKNRHRAKFRPLLSKAALFQLYCQITGPQSPPATYFETKQGAMEYAVAKRRLMGEGAVFAGWVRSGKEWDDFTLGSEEEDDAWKKLRGRRSPAVDNMNGSGP